MPIILPSTTRKRMEIGAWIDLARDELMWEDSRIIREMTQVLAGYREAGLCPHSRLLAALVDEKPENELDQVFEELSKPEGRP